MVDSRLSPRETLGDVLSRLRAGMAQPDALDDAT